ncbi:MAG: hypothetical protein ACLFUL_17515, partial [Desulfobacteraceae bacterium]
LRPKRPAMFVFLLNKPGKVSAAYAPVCSESHWAGGSAQGFSTDEKCAMKKSALTPPQHHGPLTNGFYSSIPGAEHDRSLS